jgi:uncharacterized protein YukE
MKIEEITNISDPERRTELELLWRAEKDAEREYERAEAARSPLIRQLIKVTSELCSLCEEASRAGDEKWEGVARAAFHSFYEIVNADATQRRYIAAVERSCDAMRALDAAKAAAACDEAVMGEAAKGEGSAA